MINRRCFTFLTVAAALASGLALHDAQAQDWPTRPVAMVAPFAAGSASDTMARFIIADLTDPSSIPKELEAIVPHLAVPVQPLLEGSSRPYAMFKDYWKYDWVLQIYRYEGLARISHAIEVQRQM